MNKIIIVDNPDTWKIKVANLAIISSYEYLTNPDWAKARNLRVFNLSKSYSYQSKGYYVSLLAEARGHKPIPTVRNILDVQKPFVIKLMSDDFDGLIQRRLKDLRSDEFTLSVYFGRQSGREVRRHQQPLLPDVPGTLSAGQVRAQHSLAYPEHQNHLDKRHSRESFPLRPAAGRAVFLAQALRLGKEIEAYRPLCPGYPLQGG